MKTPKFSHLAPLFLLIASLPAMAAPAIPLTSADGTNTGGGGDASEARVNEIRVDILKWISEGGAQEIKFPENQNVSTYQKAMNAVLAPHAVTLAFVTSAQEAQTSDPESKVMVAGQPKTCRGFYSERDRHSHILCNVERFGATSPADQYRLIHHEYAGLASVERNVGASSDYAVSNQVTEYLVTETTIRLAAKKPAQSVDSGTQVTNLKNVFKHGMLTLRPYQANLDAGYLSSDQGHRGGSLRLDLEKKYLVQADEGHGSSAVVGLLLNPGLHARFDILGETAGKKKFNGELELSGFAMFMGFNNGVKERTYDSADIRTALENADEVTLVGQEPCAKISAAACYVGLPPNREKWTEAQRQEFAQRSVPVYQVKSAPSSTGEFMAFSATGAYRKNTVLDIESATFKIQLVKLSGQTSFRIGDRVQVDFGGGLEFGIGLGPNRVENETSYFSMNGKGNAYLGVEVLKVGRLAYEAGISGSGGPLDYRYYQSLSLSKIAATPVRITWTKETETVDSGKSLTTQFLMVGGSF